MKTNIYFLNIHDDGNNNRYYPFTIIDSIVSFDDKFHEDNIIQQLKQQFHCKCCTPLHEYLFNKYPVHKIENVNIDINGSKLLYYILQRQEKVDQGKLKYAKDTVRISQIKILLFQEVKSTVDGKDKFIMKQLTSGSDHHIQSIYSKHKQFFIDYDMDMKYFIFEHGIYTDKNLNLSDLSPPNYIRYKEVTKYYTEDLKYVEDIDPQEYIIEYKFINDKGKSEDKLVRMIDNQFIYKICSINWATLLTEDLNSNINIISQLQFHLIVLICWPQKKKYETEYTNIIRTIVNTKEFVSAYFRRYKIPSYILADKHETTTYIDFFRDIIPYIFNYNTNNNYYKRIYFKMMNWESNKEEIKLNYNLIQHLFQLGYRNVIIYLLHDVDYREVVIPYTSKDIILFLKYFPTDKKLVNNHIDCIEFIFINMRKNINEYEYPEIYSIVNKINNIRLTNIMTKYLN